MTTPYIISTPQPPVGAVYPFIGGGTTSGGTNPGDPNGWVLCDGQTRNAPNNDGRYAELAPLLDTYLGVPSGTNTSNQITPPNFTSRMPIGHTGASSTVMTQGGTGDVMLKNSDLPSIFNFQIASAHNHSFTTRDISSNAVFPMKRGAGSTPYTVTSGSATTGINSVKFVNNSQTAVSLFRSSCTINYIMKY